MGVHIRNMPVILPAWSWTSGCLSMSGKRRSPRSIFCCSGGTAASCAAKSPEADGAAAAGAGAGAGGAGGTLRAPCWNCCPARPPAGAGAPPLPRPPPFRPVVHHGSDHGDSDGSGAEEHHLGFGPCIPALGSETADHPCHLAEGNDEVDRPFGPFGPEVGSMPSGHVHPAVALGKTRQDPEVGTCQ